ncbi:VanZ family protein [Agromyces silvae]|uniref:VanZ family protein n=1 Tax=Agromyces silvae TaxID=3388266 RepID=UPI00280AC6BF|nr:VanZ family protein [Agromyces protaetiae]
MAAWIRRTLWIAFALTLLLQLVVLYVPSAPAGPGIPGFDKLVHTGVFLLPAALGVVAGIRAAWLAAGLAVHAVVSELVQLTLLPARAGDVWDVVADLVGVALGTALGLAVRHRIRARASAAAVRDA